MFFFFFKQKTAYEMRISDWSSDVCSSDLRRCQAGREVERARAADIMFEQIVKLGLEGGVPLCGSIFALQIEDERHERFGDEAATEFPEMTPVVRLYAQAIRNISCMVGGLWRPRHVDAGTAGDRHEAAALVSPARAARGRAKRAVPVL